MYKHFITASLLTFTFSLCTVLHVPGEFPTIQMGLNNAEYSDTVLVESGTYYENIIWPSIARLKLIGHGPDSTIIDGSNNASVVRMESSIIDTHTVISGFSITNGYAHIGWPENTGGGIYLSDSDPKLEFLDIGYNYATTSGGGIQCSSSSPLISNCIIHNNTAPDGGGIGATFQGTGLPHPVLNHVIIRDNTAIENNGIGGGIFALGGTYKNVLIAGNSAMKKGGGLFLSNTSDETYFENVTIVNNSAGILGGGIYIMSQAASIHNSIMWNNSPQQIYTRVPDQMIIDISYTNFQGGMESIQGYFPDYQENILWQDGNLNIDPLFVGPHQGNYALDLGSPCIDHGDPQSSLDPDNTQADMGWQFFDQSLPGYFVNFTADSLWGEIPFSTQFSGFSIGGEPIEWQWDFDFDGSIDSYDQNPQWIFDNPQYFTVSLTVMFMDTTVTEIKDDFILAGIFGCTDDNALNYYPNALNDNGSCIYKFFVSTEGSNAGEGSENDPFQSIQYALNQASTNDTIFVSEGIYNEHLTWVPVDGIKLIGQNAESTIIDGSHSGRVLNFDEELSNTITHATVIEGFTLRNGYAYDGAGIRLEYAASPIFRNLIITENNCEDVGISCSGGGIHCMGQSHPIFESVIISNNYAEYGGGFYCKSYSSPTFIDVAISGNSARYGGGINSWHCDFQADRIVVDRNYAIERGGGIYIRQSSPSIDHLTLTMNSADAAGDGLYVWSNSNPVVTNSIFWENGESSITLNNADAFIQYSNIEFGWEGEDNLNTDPLFINPGNANYQLDPNSPCIDAGNPNSPLDSDGTVTDMGAYFVNQFCTTSAKGDVNADEDINIFDIMVTIQCIVNLVCPDPIEDQCTFWTMDFNDDSEINILDILLIVNIILG